MDEYSSQIFMGGVNTISSYNVCEDSLLATPLMYDLIVLGELFSRMQIDGEKLGPVLSYLSFFFKAPITNHDEYVINTTVLSAKQQQPAVIVVESGDILFPTEGGASVRDSLPK